MIAPAPELPPPASARPNGSPWSWPGVAHIEEALALRAAGVDAPLLAWLHTPESDFAGAVAAGVDLGCSVCM